MDHALLSTYLNDHLAGATAGRALAQRSAEAERAGPYGAVLAVVASEITDDRAALVRLMRALDVRRNPVKVAAGRAGALLGRLKTNRRLVTRSPLSRVVEIEGLVVGVRGKLALWTALRTIAPSDPRIGQAVHLEDLVARAESQLERLEEARQQAFQGAMLQGANDRL
jgi:hypothetical protein